MSVLHQYLERFGRPMEFYTDKASLFNVNRRLHYNKHLTEEPAKTQIGRALEELGIGWMAAHSPLAKGRVERSFDTAQDRLVKGLRVAGITTLEEANYYLEPSICHSGRRSLRLCPPWPMMRTGLSDSITI